MNSISGVGNNSYFDPVQKTTRRSTLNQIADAKQSGNPVDKEQIQSSNQDIRDSARETGVALYSQKIVKQSFETYANASSNNANSSADSDNTANDGYTFDPEKVNDAVQTAQKRALGISLYENQENKPDGPTPKPVDISV